jgi:hypothetical protein
MVYDKGSKSSYLCLNNAIARIDADSSLLYKSSVKRSLWVSGITVVIRDGAALVLRKGAAQLVKDAVESLKEAGRQDLL